MKCRFEVTKILMNGQFECIRGYLANLHIHLNIFSNDYHIGDIESLNQTIKETSPGIYNTIQFIKVPCRMIVEIIALVVFWINALPPLPYITGDLITHQIIS